MHNFPLFSAVAIALILLTGCETVRYEYDAPSSRNGRQCVSRCEAIKETCYGNQIDKAQQEKDRCQRNRERDYRSCLSRADNKDRRNACEKERKRESCWTSESTERCESSYRRCFTNCGGTVTKHVEEVQW